MYRTLLFFTVFPLSTLLNGQELWAGHQKENLDLNIAAERHPVEVAHTLAPAFEVGANSTTPNFTTRKLQEAKPQRGKGWNLGLGLALAQPSFTVGHPSNLKGYYCELVNSTLSPSLNIGRMVSKGNMNLMNINLVLSYLRFKEDDQYEPRNTSFDLKMAELLAISDFYVLNLLRDKSVENTAKLLPFLRAGLGFGIGHYTIVNGNVEPKPVNFALPFGFGLRWELSEKLALVFDYMSRFTFSDSLDGLTSPSGKNDWYGSGGVGLSFRLGKEKVGNGVVGK